jgi:hypothetical protein
LQLNAPGKHRSERLCAFDTDPVLLQIVVGQRGAEKPNRERENEELEGEKGIIRKRTASCIVPRKRPRDRFRTLDTERVIADIEGGQRGAEHIKPNRNAEMG